jgi:hypothetical protein
MRHLIVSALILLPAFAMGQLGFERYDAIPVTEENGPLAYPWAGGVNHAQCSNLDLNGDGINDLVVFDKSGDKLITFLMDANGQLTLAPNYRQMFTNQHNNRGRLHDWVLLRDFNCDGKTDIFTYSNGGFAVYRNDGNNDTLIFALMTDELISDYQPLNDTLGELNVYVSPVDLPAIMDVENDGDIDIVTFSLNGYAAEYHRNMSMELYGHCDSLVYQLDDACWGNFSENPASVAVNLGFDCEGPGIPTPESRNGALHSGFTLLGLDIEGDGDKDLLISKVSFNNINLLTNGGTTQDANMILQDDEFPLNNGGSDPMDIYAFPVAFLADVNNDGKDDLICTAYQEGNGHNNNGTWLYMNTGTEAVPQFTYSNRTFLHDGMIDLGTAAYPVFFDYDNDGLQDMMVGNFGYFISTGTYSAQLAYYRNTGTASLPAFTLQDRDLLDISGMALQNVAPTFGDIDTDGDHDLIVGDGTGRVHLFTNSAGAGNPSSFTLTGVGFQGIDISGQFATPQLYDVNDDDLLDLIIGEMTGNLNYFRNEGTPTSPVFVLADATFGGIDMRSPGLSFGYSAPFFFRNGEETVMMVGSEGGRIAIYDGLNEILSGPELLTADIGNGTAVTSGTEVTPFGFSTKSGRHQYLIKASELQSQGIGQGAIRKLGIEVLNGPSVPLGQFNLKMAATGLQDLSGFSTGLQSVHFSPGPTLQNGLVEFNFANPFIWDGLSNIVVEVCWYHTNASGGTDLNVRFTTTDFASNAFANANNFNGCNIAMVGTSNQRPNFTLTVKPTLNLIGDFPVFEGERTVPFGADVNDDGLLDLAIGNLAGGLAFYRGSDYGFNIGIEEEEAAIGTSISLFPNPNNGSFTVVAKPPLAGNVALRVSDLQGRMLWASRLNGLGSTAVATDGLPSGMYLLETTSAEGRTVQRFIVNR